MYTLEVNVFLLIIWASPKQRKLIRIHSYEMVKIFIAINLMQELCNFTKITSSYTPLLLQSSLLMTFLNSLNPDQA